MITYARSRLWVGIFSVGTWVLLSMMTLLNIETLSAFFHHLSLFDSIIVFLGFYIFISFPFDMVGGFYLPRKYERNNQSFSSFLLTYIRGIFLHSIFLFIIAFLLLNLFTTYSLSQSLLPLIFTCLVLQLILSFSQATIAKIISKFTISNSSEPSHEVWESSDIGFTGGIPLPGIKSIIPKHWIEKFSSDEIQLLLNRRNFLKQTHSHYLGVLGAIIFNLFGVLVGYGSLTLLGITLSTHGYMSFLLVWASSVSLWSFLGLLILPSLSQKATLLADISWKNEDRNKITHLITNLDHFQDSEPRRKPQIQKIFHPIASVELRLQALEKNEKISKGTWHIARYCLYYSWSILSLLGRAVHCNVGRSHLWVFLPSDG